MTKKDYILKLLNSLKSERKLAEPLITLVENDAFDEKTIETITNVFKNAVKTVSKDIKASKLKKGLKILQDIKNQENLENQKEKTELSNIEKELENI